MFPTCLRALISAQVARADGPDAEKARGQRRGPLQVQGNASGMRKRDWEAWEGRGSGSQRPAGARRPYAFGTMTVGSARFKSTLCVVEPKSARPSAARECVPKTSIDAPSDSDRSTDVGEGPSTDLPST